MQLLLIILAWIILGYAGCRIIGLSNEYMDYFAGQTFFFISCGALSFIVAVIFRLCYRKEYK